MLLTLPNETSPEFAVPKAAVLPNAANLSLAANVLPRLLELRPPKVVQAKVARGPWGRLGWRGRFGHGSGAA